MEGETENSHLLQMPSLVIEKILSNILNLSNISRTCKYFYEIVCQMEKRRRVICIRRVDPTNFDYKRLTIDDDAVFASIMKSLRTITNIRLHVNSKRFPYVVLNERQLERLTAIMKHFGANISLLELRGIAVSIDKIIEWLNETPKLQSLEFYGGKAFGRAITSLNLLNLKKLSMRSYPGLLEIIDLLPAGSLNDFRTEYNEPEILQTILSKQHNIKTLQIDDRSDPRVLCVNHLQLEKLELERSCDCNNDQLVEILKCHTNLKELRLVERDAVGNSVRTFEWICDNLNELEVLHTSVDSEGKIILLMLAKLKKLRYFSTKEMIVPDGQLKIDSLTKLKIEDNNWLLWPNEHMNQMMGTMVRTFTNLTSLEIELEDFSEMTFVLCQCATLIHLTSTICDPNPHQLAQRCFPNIRHLTIETKRRYVDGNVIISIVRAMPNLKSLWMRSTNTIFNITEVKEFILTTKSLEELNVDCFKLDHGFSATGNFIATIRRLSDQLKAYRFRFELNGRPSNLKRITETLSIEFNVRDETYGKDFNYFVLCKGVLSEFRGYL